MECPNCGKDVDNLEDHNSQFHNALECYATERTKSEIKEEIDELQIFINIASFENPMNVGSDKEKLSALQVELANATEGGQGSGPRKNFNKTMKDKPLPLLGPQENDYDRLLHQASSGQKIDPDLKELDQKLKGEADTDDYEVDVDEYIKTGEPVQKIPEDKRAEEDYGFAGGVGGQSSEDAQRVANNIMEIAGNLWDSHGWGSGGEVDRSVYESELKNAVYGEKITREVLSILTDENFHTEEDILSSLATEIEHQEDKPEMTQKDWDKELTGLKDDYATEEDEEDQKEVEDFVDKSIKDIYDNEMPEKPSATEDEDERCKHCGDLEDLNDDGLCDYCHQEASERDAYEVDETETSDDGTDVNTPAIPDVDNTDTDDTGINDGNRYPAEFSTETWDKRVTFNTKVEAFEGIGLNQGDALKLAELNWRELSIEVRGALNEFADDEKEEKRKDIQDAFNDEGAGVGADQPDTTIKDLDEIDYNIIGDNPVAVEKYECEHCNSGFKSNEALMIHYNDIHVPAREFMLDVPNTCTYCGQEIPANVSMGEHLAYEHGISLDVKLENGQVEDGFEQYEEEEKHDVEQARQHMNYANKVRNEDMMDDERDSGWQAGGEGGQGSGPHASLPEQAGRDPSLQYDPFTPDPDPVGDPRSAKLTEAEGGWDECQDCGFVGNTTEDTEKHKQETGHNTEHFGFQSAVSEGKIKGNENLKKKNISIEIRAEERSEYWSNNFYRPSEMGYEDHFRCKICGADVFRDDIEQHYDEHDARGDIPTFGESWKPHIFKATEVVGYEEFREEDHPRDGGKFTTKGGGATKQKEKPKPNKNFNKAKDKILKHMGEPKTGDSWETDKYNKIKNLDGYPQHSSQLKNIGVKYKAPIMKAHLNDTYPDNKWSVRTEYFSMGSSLNGHWTGGGQYPYGANEEVAQMYTDSGATNMMVDYSDVDNYVSLYDGRPREERHQYDPQTIAKSREERLEGWVRGALDNVDYTDSRNWSQTVAKHLAKDGEIISFQGMTDAHKEQIKKVWGEFQEQERKEGGTGHKAKQVSKSTSPASYTQQYMGEDPDKPSEVPIDPETKEELPASPYHSKDPALDPQYKKTSGTPEEAKRQMQIQKRNLDSPHSGASFDWQKKGEVKATEAYAKEDYIPDPYKKHFDWVASMDQDDYVCKHCGEMMMNRDGTNALHTAPESEIIEVVKQHLSTHGITESYAKEVVEHEKCPHCNFETSWKGGDEWQKEDAKTEMNNHIVTHGTTEAYAREYQVMCEHCGNSFDLKPDLKCEYCGKVNDIYASAFEGIGQDVSDNWDYGINKQEILDKAGVDNKWEDYTWHELPKEIQDQITNNARSYEARATEQEFVTNCVDGGSHVPLNGLSNDICSKCGKDIFLTSEGSGYWFTNEDATNWDRIHGGESKATEDTFSSYDIKGNLLSSSSDPDISGLSEDEIFDLPVWKDKEEAKRLYQQLKDSEGFVTEDDPDFENDPDYQGFVDGKKKESSQYTQQGITDAMADPDYDKLDEVKANEVECPTCGYGFDSYEEMDAHQRQEHVPDNQ